MTVHERLTLENQILLRDGLSQFRVYRSNDLISYYLWGTHTTNSGRSYQIWSPIPNQYPYERPPIYINKPNPLPACPPGRSVNSYGTSHSMHTLRNGPKGEVQICHWRDDRWHSAITLNKVMLKVVLWLEAYRAASIFGFPD